MHRGCALFLLVLVQSVLVFGASKLPDSEWEALRAVADSLNKTNWDFSKDPCIDISAWVDHLPPTDNNVTCDCSIPGVEGCHIVAIILNYENLPGVLPANLSGLPYLQILDLKYNYLHGNIPPEWGSTQLVNISLSGNRLTGSIPVEIGNISTLQQLAVEYNQLSGTLPNELGNLINLQHLFLTSNDFNGQLPESLGKLISLTDFRIGDNPFIGPIPSFLQNLTNLTRLIIQGTNLSGPIPSGIKFLVNMVDLRISDLINGTEALFPPLNNYKQLNTLVLRNCNITGPIPDYIGTLTGSYKLLDLSFNKLSGPIPQTFVRITASQFMFLTGNRLSGPVPDFLSQSSKPVDLSYNNFSFSAGTSCQIANLNLFASSSMSNVSKMVPCLNINTCPRYHHTMNINCGGDATEVGKIKFDEDKDQGGASRSYKSVNWAVSSTGIFIDYSVPNGLFIQQNSTNLSTKERIYFDARISPVTLTYYGFCLKNGNYTLNLYFAETKFTGDQTYTSLGRRIFDIYVQGKLVRQDFNIEEEAGGAGKPVKRNFTAIVDSNTLEIRFYWAGKGTTGIPYNGVFGPLISAISLSPDFPVPSNGLSKASIASIVAAAIVAISLILGIVWWACFTRQKNAMEEDLKGIDLRTGSFTLRQIKAATNNFDHANKIGEGGFGQVFKGRLLDGTTIAVKQLSSISKQGSREFINEVGMISALHHPNLVKLYGCCMEGNQLILVYEYMENNSLARALHGPEEHQLSLDWPTRQKICIGIARGLAFLHEESTVKIVHRDIKATNVLLDKNLNPKISDFGLAKLNESGENTHMSTRIAGTYGYMAPEYAMRGQLTSKADVYSFGVVILEIVSGKSNTNFRPKEEDCYYLLDWALLLKQRGKILELIDPRMGIEYDQDEVMTAIDVALLCTNVSPAIRPVMSAVVSMLEGKSVVQDVQPVAAAECYNPLGDVADGPWSSSPSHEDLYSPRFASSVSENTTLYTYTRSDSHF